MTSPGQRAALWRKKGIEQVLIMPFDRHVAQLTPEQFVEQVLVRKAGRARGGAGPRFLLRLQAVGQRATCSTELGRKYGFTTEEVKAVTVRGRLVSSTALRQLIEAGPVAQAARLLERPYALEGAGGARPRRGIEADRAHAEPGARIPKCCRPPASTSRAPAISDAARAGRRSPMWATGLPFADSREISIETFCWSRSAERRRAASAWNFCGACGNERKFPDAQALKQQILRDVARSPGLLPAPAEMDMPVGFSGRFRAAICHNMV